MEIKPSYEKYEALRNEKGYTNNTDVSKKTGIPLCSFSSWKAGKRNIKADKILKIAKLFDVEMEYFYTN